mmetsp:Transcript_29421/g.58348  ORF Transcript_29421/g.58348 Transcript_29421/m.58348 type:complete len:228 (+) Transcript_29421:3499-4182(+)
MSGGRSSLYSSRVKCEASAGLRSFSVRILVAAGVGAIPATAAWGFPSAPWGAPLDPALPAAGAIRTRKTKCRLGRQRSPEIRGRRNCRSSLLRKPGRTSTWFTTTSGCSTTVCSCPEWPEYLRGRPVLSVPPGPIKLEVIFRPRPPLRSSVSMAPVTLACFACSIFFRFASFISMRCAMCSSVGPPGAPGMALEDSSGIPAEMDVTSRMYRSRKARVRWKAMGRATR